MSDASSQAESGELLVQQFLRTGNTDLREEIVRKYASMVQRIARRYSGLDPMDDLVQVGYIGLLNALNLFQPSKGVRFNTYATHLVTGAIKHHLRDKSKIIREPAWLQEVRHRVNRAAAQLQQELGRIPTDLEIASRADVTPDVIQEVRATEDLFRVTSLTPIASSDDSDDGEEIDFPDDGADALSVEDRFVLESAISGLRDLERKVLTLLHYESLNQTEIAARLDISPNYVSHIIRQSTAKIRAFLSNEDENDRVLRRQMSTLTDDVLDQVTEAYSEEYVLSRLDEECARASCNDTKVALICVQFEGLDRLRQFYGPDAVDSFLHDAAEFLRGGVRRLDIVGRLGETGFSIVLPGAGEQVSIVISRIYDRIADWLSQESVRHTEVSVLLGSASYPESGRSARKLHQAAAMQALRARPKAA